MRLALLIAVLAVLVVLPEPGIVPGTLVRTNLQTPNTTDLETPLYTRTNVGFPCSGVRCEAWFYMPKRTDGVKPPVVLLAHGMGGQRDTGLHKYSAYFADAGLAVFTFDYRGFGGSEGEPRHWVSPSRHLQDWQSAFDYITGEDSEAAADPVQQGILDAVDSSKIVLWGTSFGGGHALVLASRLGSRVKAVVAQVPHLDAAAATKASIKARGPAKSLRVLLLGLKDFARHALGLPPLYVPLAGVPGSLALMQLEGGDMEHYLATRPAQPQGGWRNMAPARLTAELFFKKYSPIKSIPGIDAPVLFVASRQDTLCPFDRVEAATKLAKKGSLISRDVTHFQLTGPEHLPSLMKDEVAWVLEALTAADNGGGGRGRGRRRGGDAGVSAGAGAQRRAGAFWPRGSRRWQKEKRRGPREEAAPRRSGTFARPVINAPGTRRRRFPPPRGGSRNRLEPSSCILLHLLLAGPPCFLPQENIWRAVAAHPRPAPKCKTPPLSLPKSTTA